MATIAKKTPNNFFNLFTLIFIEIIVPIIAPTAPLIDTIVAKFKSIFLFL